MEKKSISLEFKDIDSSKRTAVIAHSVYNSVDRVGDIVAPGAFTKTWKEHKDVDFLFNHKEDQIVGSVTGLYDDEEKAYTEVKFGNWKLGDDVMEMAEAKVLRGASFGYVAEKKEFVQVKNKRVRKIKELYHGETSLLTKLPAHPLAGIVSLNKAFDDLEFKKLSPDEQSLLKRILGVDQSALEQLVNLSGSLDENSELYTWINDNISRRASLIGDIRYKIYWSRDEMKELSEHKANMEKFIRNAKASDESIQIINYQIEEVKQILSDYDTASTQPITEPVVSRNENDSLLKQLLILKSQIHS